MSPDKKDVAMRDITVRFLMVMNEIIMLHKLNGGPCTNVKAFAGSIGGIYSNFSFMAKPGSNRNVTVMNCRNIHLVHGVNLNWLMAGVGDKWYDEKHLKLTVKPDKKKR